MSPSPHNVVLVPLYVVCQFGRIRSRNGTRKKRKNISITALHLQWVPCADALPNRAFLVSGAVQRATGVVYYQSIVGLVLLQEYKAPFPYLTMFIHQDQKLRHQSPKCLTYSSGSFSLLLSITTASRVNYPIREE